MKLWFIYRKFDIFLIKYCIKQNYTWLLVSGHKVIKIYFTKMSKNKQKTPHKLISRKKSISST